MDEVHGKCLSLLAACVYVAAAPTASAESITWAGRATSNATEDITSQLGLDVSLSGDTVFFTFTDTVGVASNVAEVYFEDTLKTWLDMGSMELGDQVGVAFWTGKTRPQAPPGLSGDFPVTLRLATRASPRPIRKARTASMPRAIPSPSTSTYSRALPFQAW